MSRVHHTFHVSNLKKCYADEPLVMPFEGIHVDDKLQFVEEPVEIMEREIKRLKRSRIPLVKVRWNSRRGPEFTWECEDSFKKKYPQLISWAKLHSSCSHYAKKKFVMYPRFISIFLDKQLVNVPVPLDHFPVNALTSKVFSFMVKKGKHFSGKVTPLFASMLVQSTEDEGATSERPSEPQPIPSPPHLSEAHVEPQTDPSLRSSPTPHIPDSILEVSGGNQGGQSSSDRSLSGTEGGMTLQSSMDEECFLKAKIGRKEILKEKLDAKRVYTLDYMETEDAQDVGKSRDVVNEEKENADAEVSTEDVLSTAQQKVSTDKEKVSTDRPKVSTDESKVSTDKEKDSTDRTDEGTDYIETEDAQDMGKSRDVVNEEKENADAEVSTEDVLSTAQQKVSTDKEKVSTDRPKVSTDGSKVSTDKEKDSTDRTDEGTDDQTEGRRATQTTQTTTSTMFGDDETIAQVLLNMSQAKAVSREKEKGVEFKDVEETERPRPTSTRSLLTLKPLPKIDPKDKGKKKIEEEDESETESEGIPEAEKKFKQLASDEEMARKLQEDWETEEERKRLAEEEATNDALIRNYDDIKARIEADRLLAERLQEEEREQFTVEERAKFLHDTIAAQRRFLAQQRSEAIRNKPPTKNQLRNQMMTYLKHVGNFQHSHLKTKKFEEIQALYEKIKRSDEDFIAIGSAEDERMIKEMNEKGIDSSKNESVKEEGKEEEDSEIMEKKSVITRLDKVSSPDGVYLVIYIANGNFRAFNYLIEVLHIFDRQDLFHLYELMMEQYSEITLEGYEFILWGDLKIMMESSTEENGRLSLRDCMKLVEFAFWSLKMGLLSIYSLRNILMKSDVVNGLENGLSVG
ncbi:hypothetical protein Tco_0534178 [Tanacetum coccineum]